MSLSGLEKYRPHKTNWNVFSFFSYLEDFDMYGLMLYFPLNVWKNVLIQPSGSGVLSEQKF